MLFVTAQVLRTLDYTAQTAPHIELALDFCSVARAARTASIFGLPASTPPGWRASGSTLTSTIPPLSLSSCIDFIGARWQARQTLAQMQAYQVQRVERRLKTTPYPWAECYAFHTWMKDDGDITQLDCCVNTNALILIHALTAATAARRRPIRALSKC